MSDSMDSPSGAASQPAASQPPSSRSAAAQPASGQSISSHSALLLCLLSGWLAVSLFAWFSAGVTFEVLSIKKTPEISNGFTGIPEARRERLLHRTAGAINRKMFRGWNLVQLIAGLLVLGLSCRGRVPSLQKYLAAAVFAVVLAHMFWLGPGIEQTGRLLDAPDAKLAAEAARRFGIYHGVYVVSDLLKAALLGWMLWVACRRVGPALEER